MKKITIFLLFISINSFAQSTFKKGYYVTNEGVKKEGFFMTFGENMPNTITFKENSNSKDYINLNKEEISEVNIGGAKFIQKNISFEILDKDMLSFKQNNNQKFNVTSKKEILTVLLEFDSYTLYSLAFEKNDYFFLESNNKIELLKFKKIITKNKKTDIKEYRKQIFQNFKLKKSENKGQIAGFK
jgi:hypothetical protein